MTISARCGCWAWSFWIASSSASRSSAGRLDVGHPFGQFDALTLAAVFVTGLASGLFDEDLAHGSRRGAEEVAPALPAGVRLPHQAKVRLVDQGGRLQRLPRAQLLGQRRSQAAQFVVDRRQQVRRRPGLLRHLFVTHGHHPAGASPPRKKIPITVAVGRPHYRMRRQPEQADSSGRKSRNP